MATEIKLPGILDMVSRAEGGPWHTIAQVAKMIGKSPDTLRRWQHQEPSLCSTHKMDLGEGDGDAFVWLYDDADIKRFREYATTVKPGRPKKED